MGLHFDGFGMKLKAFYHLTDHLTVINVITKIITIITTKIIMTTT